MCGFFNFMANRTEETTGRVEAVEWEREIQIEGLVPVEYETWQSRLPDEATVGQCTMKLYDTQDRPSDGAREVCGTPYTVDKGNGLGEVVQDCQYEVYAEWCEYTVPEWQEIDVLTLSGSDFSPAWPSLALEEDQREGERDAAYRCIFTTEDGKRTYNTDDLDDFMRCQPGSRWVLEVNGLNGVRTIVPDN
jgi:hypothetical protein